MTEKFDAVVVGSGFGGAVLACRLAAAGRGVLVLERGRRWTVADYPSVSNANWVWDDDEPEKQNGWIDLRLFPRMAVAQGAGVGGGSLIYANVFIEAERSAFSEGWPAEITYERLKDGYAKAGAMLATSQLPDGQLSERFKLVRDAAAATGHRDRFGKLDLAVSFDPEYRYERTDPHSPAHARHFVNAHGRPQGTCVHCGNCDIGCPVQAKNTLDLNYLAEAERHGAEIRPLHRVGRLTPLDGGYRVDFERLEEGRRVAGSVDAEEVFLAAGSLGSTELLLRCRDQHGTLGRLSPMLGHGWSANGDFLTPTVYPERTVSPTRGPTISGAISFLDGADGERYFVQDGGFPDLFGNLLEHLAARNPIFRQLVRGFGAAIRREIGDRDPMSCIMPWFGQGADGAGGVLKLTRSLFSGEYELTLDWDPEAATAVVDALIDKHKQLSAVTGGIPLVSPAWTLARYLITPHPLGGCRMADSPDEGVVDGRGRVFGHPGLYVVDGAVLSRPVGLNPSRTIAAIAETIAEHHLSG